MATDTAKVLETLGKMTVLELVELKNKIEEEWGVTAAAPVAVAAAAPAGGGDGAGGGGGEGLLRRRPHGGGRQEDPGDQGRARDHRASGSRRRRTSSTVPPARSRRASRRTRPRSSRPSSRRQAPPSSSSSSCEREASRRNCRLRGLASLRGAASSEPGRRPRHLTGPHACFRYTSRRTFRRHRQGGCGGACVSAILARFRPELRPVSCSSVPACR